MEGERATEGVKPESERELSGSLATPKPRLTTPPTSSSPQLPFTPALREMGKYRRSPKTEKFSEDAENDRVRYGLSSMQGWSATMEDAHATYPYLDASTSFFGVYDGHGGEVVAKFCANYLHQQVLKNEAYAAGEIGTSLQKAFLRMDEMMRGQRGWRELAALGGKINRFTSKIEGLIWSPRGADSNDKNDDWAFEEGPDSDFAGPAAGSTACVAVIRNNELVVANAGDSRCVLSRKGQAYNLSRDHKPELDAEKERILKAGGFIHAGRVNGSLNLARAIGDVEFKQNKFLPAEKQIVTASPDITTVELCEDDDFIVLACDGVWDVMSSQQVVDFVHEQLISETKLSAVCERVLDRCLAPSTGGEGCDNMTMILVQFKKPTHVITVPIEKLSLPSFSAMLTGKNIEPPESPKEQLVSSVEISRCSLRWKEGIAAVTATDFEVTSGRECASLSAVSSDSVEAPKEPPHNSAQMPEITMPQEEKSCQLDGISSSTSTSSGFDYDVFLSFRGPDTRSSITDFLYTRLLGARIHTFKDDEELRVGEEFGPELLKAISQSKIAIPIFSKGYASSKWCLNELVQMVECSKTRRQNIMPIFYDVTPAEVRHQIGSYEEAFLSHKEKFGANVSKWKAALNHVANLNGWDNSKKNRGEGELVDEIVKKVIDELKTAYLLVTDCLVGVENHVKEIDAMMCADSEDIRILGIHGMGGVGKTTLAKIIYNQLLHHFEACCFLSNIRGTSEHKGIEGLQNQLISNVLKKERSNISNVEEGIKMIKERLYGKKVLLLLDDADQMTHWDALIGKPAWFGLGSRIIITSRNRDIVDVLEVCYPYELMSMNFNQSLQLFCKHAFGRDYPTDDYVAFSTEVVKSTGGLPLALEAIGKLLPRRSKHVWDAILKKLKQVPLKEVKQKLKISYDALDDWQKHIFLDIACLFAGFDQRIALHLWKNSNLFPEVDLEVLQKMSLIKISEDKKIWMHDQLRGLGRDIAHKKFDKEQEKQTQSQNHEEGLDRVMETKGTKKIEALCQKFDPQLLYYFANEEVERPSNQRYTEVRVFRKNWPSNDFPANLQNKMLMLSKLRWLSWHHFPIEVKITNFSMMNIVILHLGHCPSLVDVQSIEGLASLRILKLIEIPLLERLPKLSKLKKLNELQLGHCHNLIDLQSIEGLGNLRTLKLIEIPLLKRLPDLSNLKKLTELHLRYCHGLIEIKSFDGLENLMILKLGELPLLERLPNLSNLRKLTHLDLRQCHNLVKIQGRLESLEDLSIKGCRSLDEMFDPALSFKKLKSLRIHDCEKLHLDRIWVSKFERSDRVYGNSRCLILSKMGICLFFFFFGRRHLRLSAR